MIYTGRRQPADEYRDLSCWPGWRARWGDTSAPLGSHGAGESAREVTGAVTTPVGDRLMGDPVGAAQQAIGDEAVERALAEGRAMARDAAIAYAHEDS